MRKKNLLVSIILTIAFALMAQVGLAQEKRGPSTPEERAQAVTWARSLEADPLQKGAKEMRAKLLRWLVEVPDITVIACTDFLSPLFDKDKNYGAELAMQSTFSSAAFIIEHPEKAEDEPAVHLAGLEGTLRAYEAILKVKPKAKWEHLDNLIVKRDKGELDDYVAEILKTGCKSN
jgi:hypothetical protein